MFDSTQAKQRPTLLQERTIAALNLSQSASEDGAKMVRDGAKMANDGLKVA